MESACGCEIAAALAGADVHPFWMDLSINPARKAERFLTVPEKPFNSSGAGGLLGRGLGWGHSSYGRIFGAILRFSPISGLILHQLARSKNYFLHRA
jgi:hypothetical protein